MLRYTALPTTPSWNYGLSFVPWSWGITVGINSSIGETWQNTHSHLTLGSALIRTPSVLRGLSFLLLAVRAITLRDYVHRVAELSRTLEARGAPALPKISGRWFPLHRTQSIRASQL